MDPFEALEISRAAFLRSLRQIRPGQWAAPTPCDDWDVATLVNHVIGGAVRYRMLLQGASARDVEMTRTRNHLGDDAVAAFCRSADAMTVAFHEPGALTRSVHHRAGDRTGEQLLVMRVVEWTLHGWDLARAIAASEALDEDLVSFVWKRLQGTGTALVGAGAFGPPRSELVRDVASLQARLLRFTGREP